MVENHVRENLLERRFALFQWTASGVFGKLENVHGHVVGEHAKISAPEKQRQRMEGDHVRDHLSKTNHVTISAAPWTVSGEHGRLPAVQNLARNVVVLPEQEQKFVQ